MFESLRFYYLWQANVTSPPLPRRLSHYTQLCFSPLVFISSLGQFVKPYMAVSRGELRPNKLITRENDLLVGYKEHWVCRNKYFTSYDKTLSHPNPL